MSSDAVLLKIDRFGQLFERRGRVPHENRIVALTCGYVDWFIRVGAEKSVTLCGLGVFVEEAAEPVMPDDFGIGAGGLGQRS